MSDTVFRVAEIKGKTSKGYCERKNSREGTKATFMLAWISYCKCPKVTIMMLLKSTK